ncbi:DUF885 family protein [Sphingomonas sp. PR090111-T3T-6A]|uniref:DUF885 family protein n=1 Tax=Sphingomonas sp. PR090111-T3T-6A TaxID=685778 RepID=UPI00037AD4D0|nr:DUF885 family protein [Sphingomonas sp. PR090111-T3T-6A]
MRIARRELLAGAGAAWFATGVARAASPADLRAALDEAAHLPPDAALAKLAPFEAPTGPLRLDLEAARAGLAIDVALLRHIPSGRPYRVTPRSGAWRSPQPNADAIDADTAALRADADAGILPPRPLIERTMAGLAKTRAETPAAAALDRQAALLDALRPKAPAEAGLGRLPGGAEAYTLLLRRTSGNAADPLVLEHRLVEERDALHARAARLFDRIGVADNEIGARYSTLWRDPRWLYPDDDTGRAQAVTDMRHMLAKARARLPAAFGTLPPWCADVDVRALSAEEIAAGRNGYREVPTPTRRGAYIVDLKAIRRRPRWTLPSVVAHELLPGHMVQLGLEAETPPHPLRLTYAAAFVEGWGIHAEQLAGEEGAFADPRDELGHIHWLLFRVCRALADIGIHLHGWTRADTLKRLVAWQGEPAYFAPFATELDRIAVEPASRLAEATVWLALADRMHGPDDIARHRALLDGGRIRMEQWPI